MESGRPPRVRRGLSWNVVLDGCRRSALHLALRRWDHDGGLANGDEGALLVVESADDTGWIDLEDGIEIQFPHTADNTYRTGDYWLVPARTATAEVEWPTTT